MIRLKPSIDIQTNCPSCQASIRPTDWMITGMHNMSKLVCDVCHKEFFLELPVNAGLFYPGIIDIETGKRHDNMPFENWYLSGLMEAYQNRKSEKIVLNIIKNRELGSKPVLLLNTIDSTYGHALYELFNASYYLTKKEFDLVILIQKQYQWLLPDGPAQVWVADIPFLKANNWNDEFASQVKQLLAGIRDVFLCRSFVQADSNDFDIEQYAHIRPFPLDEWNERLKTPTVTFIWRTDRFWRPVLPRLIHNRFTKKLFPGIKRLNHALQMKWILRFSREMRKQVPNVDFAIAGMDDRRRSLPSWIKDFRYPTHGDETAREQLRRYAESHLVIGCNGSSLLLPGCMAGGVIDIVPGDQWAVSAGSFPFRFTSIGDTHFRYLMVPSEITIDRLIKIMVSMLRDRAYIELQTSNPWRNHDSGLDPFAWAAYRKKAYELYENFASTSGLITQPLNRKN
jgi:hypothetical protein